MPATLVLPKTLNARYAIERELGGDQGTVVYAARDLRAGRPVALRVLRPEAAAGPGAERFLKRIELIAQLEHPNILPIVDSGSTTAASGDEVVYSVSPHVEGESLRKRLEREPQLPLEEALRIAGRIAGALEAAHRSRVIHGHVRPEGVILRGGEALIDFGAGASPVRGGAAEPDSDVVGRAAAYASPEVLQGQPADARADQYSLGAVLYEMLTGRPPFAALTPEAIATLVLTELPPRLTVLRVVPRIVERAVDRTLSKSPSHRFASVAEFAAALHGGTVAPPAAPPTPGRPRRRQVVAAALVLLATVAGVAIASRVVMTRRPATATAHSQLTFRGNATEPALSPDGRAVLYVVGGRSLVLRRLDAREEPVPLVRSAATIGAARWTGDGTAVVVAMARDSTERPATFLVPVRGGATRKVLDDVRPFDAGPDSTVIVRAALEKSGIDVVSLASGAVTRTISLPDSIGAPSEIAWSPDRRWIGFTSAGAGELWVVGAGGGSPTRVASDARRIRWAGGSDAIYFLTGREGTVDLMRIAVDPGSGSAAAEAARVTSLLAADAFDVHDDGRLVHTQTNRGSPLLTFILGGTGGARQAVEEQPLREGAARLGDASVSADGRWLAYAATRNGDRDIHVVAFGGGSPRVVTASPAIEEAPAWSPDGSRLTFAREDSRGRRVILADARTGSGQRVGSLEGPGLPGALARWSASGRHVAYYARDLRRIVVLNLERRTESIVRLPPHVGTGNGFVVPSPNGTQLIAGTRVGADGAAAMWLVFGAGRQWRRLQAPFGESFPIAWQRNGWIYLVRNRRVATEHRALHMELWRMRGPSGRPELYAALPEGCAMPVSLSADASRGVCSHVRVESDLYVASGLSRPRE